MTPWVLIIIMHWSGPAVGHVDFIDRSSCVEAAAELNKFNSLQARCFPRKEYELGRP